MAFPQRLLGDDESVVLELHPHWKRLLLPSLVFVLAVGAATYGVFALPSGSARGPLRIAIGAVALLVVLRFAIWPWLQWLTTRYVLTTHRVIVRQGVFGRSGRDIPLTRVNDVSFQHSLIDRMLGCGTVTIESAGEHGQVVLPEVPHVEFVQREIYRCVEEFEQRQR